MMIGNNESATRTVTLVSFKIECKGTIFWIKRRMMAQFLAFG
jgi:hypothetical protein